MNRRTKPCVLVFAGPNGSGKSTVTRWAEITGEYINADDIKRIDDISDLDAARKAESLRELCVSRKQDFTFETVLSTARNIELLKKAKAAGYFVKGVFVLTKDPDINVLRVKNRVEKGGHDVPRDKILSRHRRSLKLLPALIELSDICHVYDNSENNRSFFRIFKKKDNQYYFWENSFWNKENISSLTGIPLEKLQETPVSEHESQITGIIESSGMVP